MTQNIVAFLSRTEVWMIGLSLAAFLTLFWTLRGAPIAQAVRGEREEAPRGGYRDRVIASVVLGLLLIVAGAYLAVAQGVRWSLPVFALGFGIVLTLLAVNRRYRHGSPALRRTMEIANAALTASLLAGVLIVGNVLAFRYGGRPLDFTRERAFSLESLTLKQLANLNTPVTFTVFFGESPRASFQHDRVIQLLELYKAANPSMIKVEYLNPYQDLERFAALVKRVPEMAVSQSGGGILIEYGQGEGADRVVIRNVDLFEVLEGNRFEGNSAQFKTTFKGEDAVTTALIRLREEKKAKVAFTTGHGEPSTDEVNPQKPSLAAFKSRLTALGSEVSILDLLRDEVSEDLSLLVVDDPKTMFKPEEVAKLRAFLDRGGPVLMLIGSREKSGLDEILRANNLELGKGVIVDPASNYGRIIGNVAVPITGLLSHPIVDSLAQRYVFARNAAPLKILTPGPGVAVNRGVVAVPILRTTNQAWGETDLTRGHRPVRNAKEDEIGPLNVAAAVSDRPKPGSGSAEGKPRMVVISSPLMADNFVLDNEPTNLDLLMNAVSWLRGRSDLIGIKPKTHVALTLTADPVLRFRVIMVPTVMAVLLILGLGATTYVARRE
jgi:ABC-type uncharacterized transport system